MDCNHNGTYVASVFIKVFTKIGGFYGQENVHNTDYFSGIAFRNFIEVIFGKKHSPD